MGPEWQRISVLRYLRAGRLGNAMLRHRSAFWIDERDVAPGHPLYERIRAEVLGQRDE